MRATARSHRLLDSTDALGTVPIGRLIWHNCSQTTISVGIYGTYALSNAWFVARGVGVDAMAAVNLAAPVLLVLATVSTTVTMPQRGISQGLQTIVGYNIVGYNIGRGLLNRVQQARQLSLSAIVAYGVFATLVVILLADPLAGLFVDQTSVRHSISAALRITLLLIKVPLVLGFIAAGPTGIWRLANRVRKPCANQKTIRRLRSGKNRL